MREDQKCRKEGITYETNVGLKTLTETVRDNCTDSYPFSEEGIRVSLPSFTRTEVEEVSAFVALSNTRPTLYELSPDTCEVCQISAVFSSGHSLEKFNRYVLP